jgi:hypothetical protein
MDIMQPSEGCGTGSIPVAGTIFIKPLRPFGGRLFACSGFKL